MTPKASSRPHKPLQDLSTNINFDASAKFAGPNLAHAKEGISSDTTSCISSAGDATNSVKESDEDHESSTTEQGMPYPWGFYPGCYYPGYEGYFGELDAQGYHFGGEGMETQYPALQADNGSVIYCMQGYQPGFNPYSPYIPVTTVGVDGQYITQNPMLPSHIALPEYYPTLVPYASEFFPSSHLWDSSFLAGDGMHGGGYSTGPDTLASKANLSAHCHARVAPSKFNSPSEFSKSLENKGSSQSLNFSSGHGMLSQLKPTKKGNQPIQTNKSDTILAKSRYFYPTSPANVGGNGRDCDGAGTLKTAKANGVSDSVLLNEGHGAANSNCALVSGGNVVGTMAAGGNELRNSISSVVRRDQYNLPDFETKYDHALFFVIKSYSEDDIHKSIKYNVWASTPNGNKRLDSAYQYAQAKMGAGGVKCPVLLFFSVNASGQFCGVAEMTGRVDFTKSMDFWQQDKWNGFFPVKWHIIKDVPNPQLRHVILENNDGKPVTNSRDTQEVRLPQGIEMLKVFKRHASKTSILDDFDFYECREKEMQDQRISLSMPQQKVDEAVSKVQSISLSAAENVEQPETGQGAKE